MKQRFRCARCKTPVRLTVDGRPYGHKFPGHMFHCSSQEAEPVPEPERKRARRHVADPGPEGCPGCNDALGVPDAQG
jgi:hypothetical protein